MKLLDDVRLPRAWDTAAAGLAVCARALGDPRDPGVLSAASGLAFRLILDARLTPAGPHAYPWREVLTIAAERLGCDWRLVASREGEPGFERARAAAFALACDGVDARRPTLLFGVQLGEFGLARGADRDAGTLAVSGWLDGAGAPELLSRERLGADTGILFALQLVARFPVDEGVALRAALRSAVAAAATTDGWDRWQRALVTGDLDPLGLSVAAHRYAAARTEAAHFVAYAAAATRLDLAAAAAAYRRVAAMLAELARLVPYPPGPSFMLTTSLRDQAAALVAEAARAEAEAAAAVAAALATDERARAAAGLTLRRLDPTTLPDLFACVAEIPIGGLADEAAACRTALAPRVAAGDLDGRLLYDDGGGHLAGHLLWAPLERSSAPVVAPRGRRWFLYCPWITASRRGRGVGRRLFDALIDAARAAAVDGILTIGTSLDVFLHHEPYERAGWREIDRQGDTRLLELALTDEPSCARLVGPAPGPPTPGALPVVVRHAHHCPLLLRTRRDLVAVARPLAPTVAVDERDAAPGEPSGAAVAGHPLPWAPIARDALAAALADAARAYGPQGTAAPTTNLR